MATAAPTKARKTAKPATTPAKPKAPAKVEPAPAAKPSPAAGDGKDDGESLHAWEETA